MANTPNDDNADRSADDESKLPEDLPTDDGDLNFATDSDIDFDVNGRRFEDDITARGDSGTDSETHPDEDDLSKTWVPSQTPTVSNSGPPDSNEEPLSSGLSDTWVPASADDDVPPQAEVAKTPEPTGLSDTWVPASDENGPDEADVPDAAELDTDKTWVPSRTPTHHDFSFDGDDSAGDDDDAGFELASDLDESDAGEVSTTVNMNHESSGQSDAAADDGFEMGTVVMPTDDDDSNQDSMFAQTIAASVETGTDDTQVFSKSMGMRGLTEEEYDQWQQEVAEKSVSDTVVFDQSDEDDSTRPDSARRTQIWNRQTTDGPDLSLTIRSRPVEGDDLFQQKHKADQPDYKIVEKLAEGGMGAVYIARQTSLDRELAIKTLKPLRENEKRTYTKQGRMSQVQQQRREMFLSEALVTANLVHPHIIPIHDLCQTVDGSPFYSMKRVNGTPWNERITEMSQEDNLEVLHKVCDAMAYAHHNGVVNRDLKPENIMLGEFGEVLVLDWGLAVPATAEDKKRFASPSASFGAGTPAYMAPELWTGPPEAIGTWSDIYLLGAILFECITGKPPHEFPDADSGAAGSGLWAIIDSVVRGNSIRSTEIIGELMDIALKAMASDPGDRHASVLEFQEDIKHFQQHEESRRLTQRAEATLLEAKRQGQGGGYQNYQTSAALFEEAFIAWPENETARSGLTSTRIAYADLAHTKGDYDLGLQIADQEHGAEFDAIRQKLLRSRRVRNGLKSAMATAAAIIVVVGAFSMYQHNRIRSLHGDVTSLTQQADKAIADRALAEQNTIDAEQKKLEAEEQMLAAVEGQKTAETAMVVAEKAKIAAEQETTLAVTARKAADEDRRKAEDLAKAAALKQQQAEQQQAIAVAARSEAEDQMQQAQQQTARARAELVKVEEQRVRAGVDLDNAEIANLIRNADYSGALRGVQQLLTALSDDDDLKRLPEAERRQRIKELQARQKQLLKRTVPTEAPVQTQTISSDGTTVVWGDHDGRLTLWQLAGPDGSFPEKPRAVINLPDAVSRVRIGQDKKVIVAAAETTIHVWKPDEDSHETLAGHEHPVTAVELADQQLITADSGGVIRAWNLKTNSQLWSIRCAASIMDVALMRKSRSLIYAGSRGGESADILAYQLPPESTPDARPTRLGQLKLPRGKNDPPRRLVVSPDEQLLLISNSRNGDVMVLPRATSADSSGQTVFPFEHAAKLADQGDRRWILDGHQRPVNDITFSTDGQRIATASDDRSIRVWQREADGRLAVVKQLDGHGARVNAAGFLNAAGSKLISASADQFCRLWDVESYDAERQAIEKQFRPTELMSTQRATSPEATDADSKAGQSLSPKPSTVRWIPTRLPVRRPTSTVENPGNGESAAYVVINGNSSMQRGAIRTIATNADGTQIVTGATDGTAVIWDTTSALPVTGVSGPTSDVTASATFDEGHEFNMARLQFLPPDGRILLTTGFDGNLCLWNCDLRSAGAGYQQLRIPGLGLVNAVAVSDDGQRLAVSMSGSHPQDRGNATVWSLNDLTSQSDAQPLAVLSGFHRLEVSALAFSDDGRQIATGARDGRVAVWDVATETQLASGQIHAKNTIVSHLEWLPDNRLFSAGFDGRLAISLPEDAPPSGAVQKLTIVKEFQHDRIPVERVAFAPDKGQFVTISVRTEGTDVPTEYELELWTPEDAQSIRRVLPAIVQKKKPRRIVSANWSSDGHRLSAVVDGHLQIFSTSTWRIERVLDAPGLGISDAIFAPTNLTPAESQSGDLVATFDGTAAHLWDLRDKSHVTAFRPLFAVNATALSGSQDSPLLITGDRAIRFFQADASSSQYGRTLFKISDPHRGVVTSLSFSPNPETSSFVSAGADGSAILWKWDSLHQTATQIARLLESGPAITCTAWSPSGDHILMTQQNGHIVMVAAANPDEVLYDSNDVLPAEARLTTCAYSSDGRFVAVAGQMANSGESRGWVLDVRNPSSPQVHCTLQGHGAGGIRCVDFSAESPHLVTGGNDGAAIIWNWQPGRAIDAPVEAYEVYQLLAEKESVAHRASINAVAVTPSGKIVTASDDGTAIIWEHPFANGAARTP